MKIYLTLKLLEKAKELQKKSNVSTREKPEGIRVGTTHPAQIEDVKIYTTVNRNDQGQITKIYITTDREGTIITGLLNSLSKSISVYASISCSCTGYCSYAKRSKI